MSLLRPAFLLLVTSLCAFGADKLTRTQTVDFFRDVTGRNLKGLATRSDGRLVTGPRIQNLEGKAPAPILWSAVSRDKAWLVGTGPEGAVFELSIDEKAASFASRELFRVEDTHATSLLALPDGRILAGSSPKGILSLYQDGKVLARLRLPADSLFDFLPDGKEAVLVATGGPARIYRVELSVFAKSGISFEKSADEAALKAAGIRLFAEVKDRNLRRLARLAEGRVAAGSEPKANVYSFAQTGGAPLLLLENKEGEVVDLLPTANGGLYVALVTGGGSSESRLNRQAPPAPAPATPPAAAAPAAPNAPPAAAQTPPPPSAELPGAAAADKFAGRSVLLFIPPSGFPETLASRTGHSVYRLSEYGRLILMPGGEQGECDAYDTVRRAAVSLPACSSAQITDLRPLPGAPGRFLALRNNLAGFSLFDFSAETPRSAETRRVDLGVFGQLGSLRIARAAGIDPASVKLEASVSSGAEEGEGWTSWQLLHLEEGSGSGNLGWRAESPLRGRYFKLRFTLPSGLSADASLDKAQWFFSAQNRRPVLTDFRSLSPNFAILSAPEPQPSPVVTLNQLLNQSGSGDPGSERRRSAFMSSQVLPSPGYQAFIWNISDPDGDQLVSSFSIRPLDSRDWREVVSETRENFAQMDISHLSEGIYQTRLIVREEAPRPVTERLSAEFETDDLTIDRSPPVISSATAIVQGDRLIVSMTGTDVLSLLDGMSLSFNNGAEDSTEQPDDAIRDQRTETFTLSLPLNLTTGATFVDASLYDACGNRSTRTLKLKAEK